MKVGRISYNYQEGVSCRLLLPSRTYVLLLVNVIWLLAFNFYIVFCMKKTQSNTKA